MNRPTPAHHTFVLLAICMGALLTVAQTASAEPPPKPAFRVINNTPFEVVGVFGLEYDKDTSGPNRDVWENVKDGQNNYPPAMVTIPPSQKLERLTGSRWASPANLAFHGDYICVAGKACDWGCLPPRACDGRSKLFGYSGTNYEPAIVRDYGAEGKLRVSYSIGVPSGIFNTGGTGWSGQDFAEIILDWVP